MSWKKLLVASVLCGSVALGASAPALAGEITGSGKWTPINIRESDSGAEPKAAECAFSGLEDLAGPGETQTPHGFSAFDVVFPPGVARECSYANNGRKPE